MGRKPASTFRMDFSFWETRNGIIEMLYERELWWIFFFNCVHQEALVVPFED